MCRAGVYHCPDQRVLRRTDLSTLRPGGDDEIPAVDWGTHPDTAGLYQAYDAKIASATIATLRRVHDAEPDLTAEVLTAIPATARPHGLPFRVKSPQSLARKIADRARTRPELNPDEHADSLTDVLRYTAVSDRPETLVGTATATLTSLREQGWQILAAEHSYVAGNPYKGLHTLVRKGSITAELQFHTEASQALKDRTHVDYETARDATVPIPQRRGRGPGHAPGLGTAPGPARPGRPDRALRHRPDHQDLPIGGATMFYLARARNEPRSQPYVIWQQNEDAHLYVFVPNTGQFHRNDALTTDFYFDQDVNDYEPIAPERAAREVANGTGRIDERKNGWIVQEYRTDPAPIAPATILPDKDGGAPAIRSTPSQHARRIGRLLTNAEPHVWLTYRTYDPDQRQQAHTCAYDIRHGKIKALADLDLQTRIVPTSSGTLEVQVSRHPDRSQGHTAAAAAN